MIRRFPPAAAGGAVAWADVTAKPTTIDGFGITDAAGDSELAAHEADATSVHGVADMTALETASGAQTKADAAQAAAEATAASALSSHASDGTAVHGITDTAALLTTATKLDDLAAGDDNADLNASTLKHGLMQKYPGGSVNFLRSDGTFAAPTAAASISETEIDFGAVPVLEALFVIQDASVTAASRIIGCVAYVAPTGKDLDELELDSLDLKFAPGDGEFSIYARGLDGLVAGAFIIYFQVGV